MCHTAWCYGECDECLEDKRLEDERIELIESECPNKRECRFFESSPDYCVTCKKNKDEY